MGLRDQARAWYRLALHEQPDDSISQAGLDRLAYPDVLEEKPAERIDRLDPTQSASK